MNSRFSSGRQDVCALTLIQNFIPISTPEGLAQVTLSAGSAITIAPPKGKSIGRNDRRMLDAYPGPHVVMVPADHTSAHEFDPVLMAWAVRSSDMILLWGCGAYAASISEVGGWLKGKKRALVVMTTCEAEQEWFDEVNRCARRATPVIRLLCDLLNEPGTIRDGGEMPRPEVRQ